ncbi:MAG TPA: hypothetical protein VFY73_19535 [Ideonella sp.]|uniref:hypothetical protein n=1 Tax=Ideonella sp. TaxID=1929293 RepID=UPI002E36965D|nr:hypothetical protein [Ideonella sp.]HEX5686227.1 hypothetical protein [Ideonella sp.]
MSSRPNTFLLAGAGLSAVAALLHVAIIFGGAPWYRFFGAGEGMARAAEAGQWYPALVTTGIAFVLGLWAAYALAGAGVIRRLPWLRLGLCVITAIYLVRGLALLPAWVWAPAEVTPFVVWSSVICMLYGAVHVLGVVRAWPQLSRAG